MLNLSDKELDRFSKEAAQEYEPGDVLGERAWERLEVRLDRDLGRVSPNPLRHFRRFPFYYAPALLVLLGVSYYLTKRSGSPPSPGAKPAIVQNPSSSQSPVYLEKSTPTTSTTSTNPAAAGKAEGGAVAGNSGGAGSAGVRTAGTLTADSLTARDRPAGAGSAGAGSSGIRSAATGSAATRSARSAGVTGSARAGSAGKADLSATSAVLRSRTTVVLRSGTNRGAAGHASAGRMSTPLNSTTTVASNKPAQPKELTWTTTQGLRPTKKTPYIDDSALRAFTLKSTPPQLIRKGGAHINRSLTFGVVVAPDFASVNALAGDRPGSTIGLTADYQFANHWYVGSGLLLDRKIFAARGQDFHAPSNSSQSYGTRDVQLIKGSFEMLEIPLNLRYDFTTTGSTLFFASGGMSSYLLTSENDNYYYHNPFINRDVSTPVSSSGKSFLFSALNLSLGVETGLSNSLSLLIAPYMKIPVRGMGIGQVQMNTVGINFSLRFAPVISRKRY